jgi:exopolyphosphatase/guanosine-5'-triphosphate,3'-diphosphate pyrophosphatase
MQGARLRHGTVVSRADAEHVLESLAAMSPAERTSVSGLTPERADIIVAGLAVAAEILAVFEGRELLVSGYGIREGILLEAAQVEPRVSDPGEARERSIRGFAERSHYDAAHGAQVRKLSLQLYDQLGVRLGCELGDREILADAALLHDVGYHISHASHHKHSYHLIRHAELLGIAPAEQIAIANVARYHRGPMPKKRHPEYGSLDRTLRRRIRRLSAILRVADGLDRGHGGAVDHVDVEVSDDTIRIRPIPVPGVPTLRLEVWGGERKSDLLAKLTGGLIEIVEPEIDATPVLDASAGNGAVHDDYPPVLSEH